MRRKLLIYAAVIFVAAFFYIKYIESKSVFFPYRPVAMTPSDTGLSFEDIWLKTADNVRINAWFIPADAKYTILLCHGNAGNVSTRLEKIALLRQSGANVLIFDYRGYGNSDGKPSEKGVYLDARAAYDYLVKERQISPKSIVVYGESLGGAVAIDLAAQVETAGLIAESTFSRAADMAKVLYPYLPPFIFSIKLDSLSKINKVTVPKLFLHSKDDHIVPFALARKLFQAAGEPKVFVEISGSHNRAFLVSREKYTASIGTFIKGL